MDLKLNRNNEIFTTFAGQFIVTNRKLELQSINNLKRKKNIVNVQSVPEPRGYSLCKCYIQRCLICVGLSETGTVCSLTENMGMGFLCTCLERVSVWKELNLLSITHYFLLLRK